MNSPSLIAIGPLLTMAVVGCGSQTRTWPADGPFGAPNPSVTLAPFAGKWVFDLEKTLAAQKAAGEIDEEEVAELRVLFAGKKGFDTIHDDLIFDGNVAMGAEPPESVCCEYRFFRMHHHGSKICGRAWHHEDRFDPGDMSKCYVRLEPAGEALRLEVFMEDGYPDDTDPDLVGGPPVDGGAAECDLEMKTTNMPGDWTIYVFRRGE